MSEKKKEKKLQRLEIGKVYLEHGCNKFLFYLPGKSEAARISNRGILEMGSSPNEEYYKIGYLKTYLER